MICNNHNQKEMVETVIHFLSQHPPIGLVLLQNKQYETSCLVITLTDINQMSSQELDKTSLILLKNMQSLTVMPER